MGTKNQNEKRQRLLYHPLQLGNLTLRSVSGKYAVHGDLNTAQCIVAQSFGGRKDFRKFCFIADPVNDMLADFIDGEMPRLPIIAQTQIARALKRQNKRECFEVIPERSQAGRYQDTHTVAAQAGRVMQGNGWRTAALVGHPYHLPRIDATFRAMGVNTVVSPGIFALWDNRSYQGWTRNELRWSGRELPVIGLYAVRKYI